VTRTHDAVRLPVLGDYRLDSKASAEPSLLPVERFARRHDELGDEAGDFDDLIPLSKPQPGEQYAFHVALDQCTGCKACVTACHSLNGLAEDETWRFVGLLHGGTPQAPVQQTVTTACHHCVDPACLKGCPVEAYEKDPLTGIVKHLDDQCIGCQYCTLTCPYDVPQFSPKLGIVRKCDMCSDRLAVGEAPACVQACPNDAISIRVVSQKAAIEDAQGEAFLPGSPSPALTVPTTTYATSHVYPRNTLPADFYAVRPAHQHRPLVVMLVLTQLSAGAFLIDQGAASWLGAAGRELLRPVHSLVALSLGLLALGASIFHLGRPLYAFRAVLGIRTSWLSREIIAFALFAKAAILYAAVLWREPLCAMLHCPTLPEGLATQLEHWLGLVVAGSGALGVLCSVMVYHVTQRRFWSFERTGFTFLMTTLILGTATTLFTTALCALFVSDAGQVAQLLPVVELCATALPCLGLAMLLFEGSLFLHLGDKQQGDLKRSATLLATTLRRPMLARWALFLVGMLPLPWWCARLLDAGDVVAALGVASLALGMMLLSALVERSLYFAAVSAPRMPGTVSG
jgi:formate dehydrogenase iron-sulfur subunit